MPSFLNPSKAVKRLHKQSAAVLVNAILRKIDRSFTPVSLPAAKLSYLNGLSRD